MAQWNPYYGTPNQDEIIYGDQNVSEQNYYNPLPYASVSMPMPLQQVNYDGYYVPNSYPGYAINLPGTMFDSRELEAHQFRCYTQNAKSDNSPSTDVASSTRDDRTRATLDKDAVSTSKLTATAAEFKPSTSNSLNDKVSSQTFYRNSNKKSYSVDETAARSKGATSKHKKPTTTVATDTATASATVTVTVATSALATATVATATVATVATATATSAIATATSATAAPVPSASAPVSNKSRLGNDIRQDNRKSYNRNTNSYRNDRYSNYKPNSKYERERERTNYNSNRNGSDERNSSHERNLNYQSGSDRASHSRQQYTSSKSNDRSISNKNENADDTEESKSKNESGRSNRNQRGNDERYNKYESRDEYSDGNNDNRKPQEFARVNQRRQSYGSNTSHNSRSGSRNNYRSNNRYEKNYENWRNSGPSESTCKQNENVNKGKKDKYESKHSDRHTDWRQHKQKTSDKDAVLDVDVDGVGVMVSGQRERLVRQTEAGTLECLVCCERVRRHDRVWACHQCYHIYHLRCITKWADTSKDDKGGWRCPACQHVLSEGPGPYRCYCGRARSPAPSPLHTAHSCGEPCTRPHPRCPHPCTLTCHPGPCPKCIAQVYRSCNCGATKQIVLCSADETALVCAATCAKLLNCGVHTCQSVCHVGPCQPCLLTIQQECYCTKSKRSVSCSTEQHGVERYACELVCGLTLTCGNHTCQDTCHEGPCGPCPRAPDQVHTCPCGQTKLQLERTSCLDPVPVCHKVCGKQYTMCGTASNPHVCQSTCHEGDCPICPLTSAVRCRCGHMACEMPCKELVSRTDDARCQKKCTKKRSCGKHKCGVLCCIEVEHACPLPCSRVLSCGQHRCEATCHKGRCLPCWRTSFTELYCECGGSVVYPPVACGTRRPACSRPCSRQHACTHPATHTCHTQHTCPPCTVLVTRYCHGKHEKRSTIPCHQKEFSCGLPCGRELPCGRHTCQLACHAGPCLKDGQTCAQPCVIPRDTCGHACGLPCHITTTNTTTNTSHCPASPCKQMVHVSCECGLRRVSRACADVSSEYQRIATSLLASKMQDVQQGHTVHIADILGTTATARKPTTLKTLECNDECRLVERNRRLAIGLQIRNPDLSSKLTPRYSDFMRQWVKKDAAFCQMIHDKLTELVQLAKQSKQKCRSYSFPCMNREKRQLVHEYAEHFGCDSAAYDHEPNRNVVATAHRDKAWLPSCSLLELVQRESGQRKVPGPILNRPLSGSATATATLDTVSFKVPPMSSSKAGVGAGAMVTAMASTASASPPPPTTTTSSSTSTVTTANDTRENIDYFDFPTPTKRNM